MLALSTTWNSHKHRSGLSMIEEILGMGFNRIELGHGIRAPLLQGVLEARAKHSFTISSLHNFCPMPPEVMADAPDCYEFTSHRPDDRRRAVSLTRQTIDWAERLGAPVVVVHTGRIRSLHSTERLRTLVTDRKYLTKQYAREKLRMVQEREKLSVMYLERARECVAELAEYAGTKGVRLGVENREHYEAVPSEREFPGFLQSLASPHAGYWHDFGHAQIKHNLSLIDHAEWLAQMGPSVIGCHLHDAKWPFEDHCPPFTGGIDFARLVPMLPSHCQFVLEMHPRKSAEDIKASAEKWHSLFGQ